MPYELSKNERREIQLAFRDVRGDRLNGPQKKIVKKYGLDYGISAKSHAYLKIGKIGMHFPLTPSDWRGGRNVSKRLIDLIQENHHGLDGELL
jgi:hypothetical protein